MYALNETMNDVCQKRRTKRAEKKREEEKEDGTCV